MDTALHTGQTARNKNSRVAKTDTKAFDTQTSLKEKKASLVTTRIRTSFENETLHFGVVV